VSLADQVLIPQVSASFPGSVSRDGKKLVNRFMEANPRLCPGVDPQKFSRCRSRSRDGADPLVSTPIGIKSYPAITVLSPGSGYGFMLTLLLQFQAQARKYQQIECEDSDLTKL
jgi:hypothetical protein